MKERLTPALLFIGFLLTNSLAHPLDLAAEFGKRNSRALQFLAKNRQKIYEILPSSGADPRLLISVVYPELLRYSAIEDRAETAALRLMYTGGGSRGADFSIGWFQMKPSFAESVETGVKTNGLPFFTNLLLPETGRLSENRRERIRRLSQTEWQLRYLAAFFAVVRKSAPDAVNAPDRERVLRYLCAIYNAGLERSVENSLKLSEMQLFPDGKGRLSLRYGDIAVNFWKSGLFH